MGVLFALRDPVSASTHFAGFLWALFGALLLWRLCRDDLPKRLSLACFGLCMVLLYAASTIYHALQLPPAQLEIIRLLDHTAIYLLIAGTYTPVFVVLLRGRLRTILLSVMWGLAVLGTVWKWSLPVSHYSLTVAVYLGMGWVGMLSMVQVIRAIGFRAIGYGILGGIFYTLGALADMLGWPVLYDGIFGPHEMLHVLVLLGTLCHFLFIVRYVVPYRAPQLQPIPVATSA